MPAEAKRGPLITSEQLIKGTMHVHVKLCKKRPITEQMILDNTKELANAREVIGLPRKPNPKDLSQAYRVLEKYHV